MDCDKSLHLRENLVTTDIISLLNFVLSNNYFIYNNSVYKQIHGCDMGSPVSPVSPVVANLCMEAIVTVNGKTYINAYPLNGQKLTDS